MIVTRQLSWPGDVGTGTQHAQWQEKETKPLVARVKSAVPRLEHCLLVLFLGEGQCHE